MTTFGTITTMVGAGFADCAVVIEKCDTSSKFLQAVVVIYDH